jgi:hypothetical protein
MQNAMTPGKMRSPIVCRVAPGPSRKREPGRSLQLSTEILTTAMVRPMIGASQKMVAAGWFIPERLSRMSIWVSDQRRPPRALADMTRMKPTRTKCVSVATIRSTPEEIRRMTPTSRRENVSRRKKKAKAKTNTSEEDLHMADEGDFGVLVSAPDEDIMWYVHMAHAYCRKKG